MELGTETSRETARRFADLALLALAKLRVVDAPGNTDLTLERLGRVIELTAEMDRAVRRGDYLTALRTNTDVIARITALQEWMVDSARAANVKDVSIAEALKVTSPRIAQRFGNRAETTRRLRDPPSAPR